MVNVTKPFLPPKEKYKELIDGIWERGWLTNNGPLVVDLEDQLKRHLNVPNLLFLSNGTIALQIAIKALSLKGEVITTPFSYVATTSTIIWENCTPVFVDIDEASLNIDPAKIEAAITDKTTAILATHVYGNPCDISAIATIAQKHDLKVVYDAAHCFRTKYEDQSVFNFGDISTISFHATKLFHTGEGGAVVTTDNELNYKMEKLRNFGHNGPTDFVTVGVNGKNSEFHAAMGLANLPYIEDILKVRKYQYQYYYNELNSKKIRFISINKKAQFNYAYCPVIFKTEKDLLKVVQVLNDNYIYPRRYFYPSLNTLDYLSARQDCPISETLSSRVLSLPLYHVLEDSSINMICNLIKKATKN